MATPQLIRTLVFLGGHDLARIEQVAAAGPDAICIDLEDSTPLAKKDAARTLFGEAVAAITAAGALVVVRTNMPGAGEDEDLAAVMCPQLHAVSLPKVESAEAVQTYDETVARAERAAGLEPGAVLIRPIIETAQGVRMAYEISAASPRVAYLGGVEGGIFGDLGGSLGYVQTDNGMETFFLRSKVLIDARAAGVPFPIGGGMTTRRDADGARSFARENRILGYNGVHCAADPEVIKAVNDEFTPDR
ncbi:MAG TPA: aldolase/citrate lyase family protein, partial [Ilumatobacteraceae bacterium]|nr:aldolase/citrate lyase family protein [Ilumatobacteraceae bacterium]